ncbi:hypothetical protein F5148DRAFT_1160285 [Russula earlei]|uniref:Uncharacterized protein n=1 Tax=Russula earlei TaxID=71964 RepID=A0ACC0UPP9_9AGAM|nr:hypothetical protein F5148DRAFT_1160285 [Russula earlei]
MSYTAAPISLSLTGLICRAVLTSQLQNVFANAPQAPNALAHDKVREAHARATGKASTSTSPDSKRRIPGPEDNCLICYESSMRFLETCFAKNVETRCTWNASINDDDAAGASRASEGYINLGRVAGLSAQRDTSSCALCSLGSH